MKILENNYSKSREVVCGSCHSRLLIEKSDIFNDNTVTCPCCGNRISFLNFDPATTPDVELPCICSSCGGLIEEADNPFIGAHGSLYTKCPHCGSNEWIGEGERLNETNVEFPKHFYHFTKPQAKPMGDDYLTESARSCIEQLKKGNDFWYTATGDSFVFAFTTNEAGTEATVVVCRDYSECDVEL